MKRIFVIIIILVVLFFMLYLPKNWNVSRLIINIQKYAEINIPKNSGIQKDMLILIKRGAYVFPQKDTVRLDRGVSDVGISKKYIYPYATPTNSIYVNSELELLKALESVTNDSQITVEPGTYRLAAKKIELQGSGMSNRLTVLTAKVAGTVVIELDTREGLYLSRPNWIIENLIFKGVCDLDTKCDHAIHIVGNAHNSIIQNNRFHNFNAAIKGNGVKLRKTNEREYPDNVKILNNTFVNEWVRKTKFSVTPIDVVGGNSWLIKGNFIADFAKQDGNQVTYGVFLKGAGSNGVISDNVVACEWHLPHYNAIDTRIGISLGGGGTGVKLCQEDGCPYEHFNGIITNNLILNCRNDVGIYLNKAKKSLITQNIIINSLGIDARFNETTGLAINNQHDGYVRNRDGAALIFENN